MRTQDEIATYYGTKRADDILGFIAEVLLPYLDFAHAKPYLKATASAEAWTADPIDEAKILGAARDYADFAWEKVEDHRGISASRSVQKLASMAWLLGREDVVKFMEDSANYPQYGAPAVAHFCEAFGFPIPDGEMVARMRRGEPCSEDCDEGCAR